MKSLLNSKQSVSKQVVVETYLILQTHGDLMMDKETFARVKKLLFILLLVFFVMSLTAASISASLNLRWGPESKQNYNYAYAIGENDANTAGYNAGNTAGFNDCESGLPNNGGNTNINMAPKSDAAYDIGYADGHNIKYKLEYKQGYIDGYKNCQSEGLQVFTPITTTYSDGYIVGTTEAKNVGYNDGNTAGVKDCRTGLPNNGGNTNINMASKSNIPYDKGYADGYNVKYKQGYIDGFKNCQNKGFRDKGSQGISLTSQLKF